MPPNAIASVLLVDDNRANLLALRTVLADLDLNLVEASSGEEALARLREQDFAVVLLDVVMPGINGFETATLMRQDEASRHTPIIFVTASDLDRGELDEGYALGAVDFLVKPLSTVAVKAKVAGFVDLYQQKQQARRDAEQLRLIIDSAQDYAIFHLDPQGNVASWNPGAQRIKQYRAEEIIGRHFSQFYPQEALDRDWPGYELRMAREQGRFEDEGWRVRKDGTQFWANVVITALRDENGELRGFSKITRDMTERNRAEEDARRLVEEAAARRVAEEHARVIQEQQELLRVTLASIGDAVITTDMQSRVTFLNGVAEELTGWSAQDAAGQPLETVFEILNEQSRQGVENPVAKVLRDGVIVGLANHTVLIARDGTERPIDDSAAPIRDATGKVIGVVLIFRDVTEQRRSEQELRDSEARKSAILETALDCVISMDHEGKVVEFNPAAERTFGYTREQIVGQELCQFIIPPSLRESHRQGLARYFATGEGRVLGKRLELPAMHADGREFPAELAITRITSDGRPLFTAYLRDITDRRRSEQFRDARLEVTQALSEATSVEEAVRGVLRAICEHLRWDLGFFWQVDDRDDRLECRASWRGSELQVDEIETASRSRRFQKGEGLPGKVWASAEPAWVLDIARETNFPRLSTALKHGLHSALACPIVVNERVLGVIEFLSQDMREPDAHLLEMMGTIAGSVGQFLERKQTAITLLQSEQKLRLLADTIPQLAWMAQPDGYIFWYNRRWYEYTGTTAEQMEGWGWQTVHDPRVLPSVLERWKASIASGEPFDMTFPLRRADGEFRSFLTRVNPLRDEEGRILYWFGTNTDIEEQQRAQEALAQSDQRFRELADAMPQIVWTARPDGRIDYINQRWTEFTGQPQSVGNEGWAPILHSEEAQLAHQRWAASLASGDPFEMELRLLDRRDQSYRWHLIRSVAVRDESGKVSRWFGTSTDIHEQKRAAEASRYLAEASAELAAVVDYESTLQKVASLAVPYFADWAAVDLANEDGSLRRLAVAHQNPAKVSLVQQLMRDYPPDPASPVGALAVIRSGQPEHFSDIPDELLVKSARDERHLELIRSLGLKSYICVPLIAAGKTRGVLTFATAESGRRYGDSELSLALDLARRAAVAIENTELYQALRDADRRKDEFLATLAHELRNPLAPIRNSLQILKLPRVDAETAERSREMMERQVHHLVRLVDDLLDVSRVMRGKVDLRREQVELATIIARAVEMAQPVVEAQRHALSVTVSPESIPIHGDPVRLAQVVDNLLTNAAKYTHPNGRIWLTAEREGDLAVLRVKDNGIGIAAPMLTRIFELFVQVDHTSTKSQGGLGIGLTLVKNLVEMHNGTIEARSRGLDHGTEFIVRLPVSVPTSSGNGDAPHADQKQPAPPSSGRRLLVVDDNQDSANSLAMLLKLQG